MAAALTILHMSFTSTSLHRGMLELPQSRDACGDSDMPSCRQCLLCVEFRGLIIPTVD